MIIIHPIIFDNFYFSNKKWELFIKLINYNNYNDVKTIVINKALYKTFLT